MGMLISYAFSKEILLNIALINSYITVVATMVVNIIPPIWGKSVLAIKVKLRAKHLRGETKHTPISPHPDSF